MVVDSLQQAILTARATEPCASLVGATREKIEDWVAIRLPLLQTLPVLASTTYQGPFPPTSDSAGSVLGSLTTTNICLQRSPVLPRLASVLDGFVNGSRFIGGEIPEQFDQAHISPIDTASWTAAVAKHNRPQSWLATQYVVFEGVHRCAAQILLGVPIHGRISPTPATFD